MSIDEEPELKKILYENLELFDLIDKYVGRQEEKKKGWFWGGEGENKNQFKEDYYGKILLLILKRRIEEEFTNYKITTEETSCQRFIELYNTKYQDKLKNIKQTSENANETTPLIEKNVQLNPLFNFKNNLYIGIKDSLYTQINTVKDILIKIVNHSPLHDGIKVERSTYNSAIHYKNIPIQGIKIADTNLTTLDKTTNFLLSRKEEIQIMLAELRDQLLLTYRKYVNGNYNDKRYLDILFENITQKHCKAKNAWCFFENEMVTNGWNYIVKYKNPPTEDWRRYFTSKKIRVLALHPDHIKYNYNPDKSKAYDPYGNDNSPSQDKLYLLIILAANTLNYMIHTKFKQAPCEFYKSRLAMKTNKLFYFELEPSSDALHTKSKGSITSFFNATGNIQKRLISFIIQKTKEGIESPTKLGMFIKKIISKIFHSSQQNSNTEIPLQYNHLNYFILLRITKFCNSYKKFMFGPASETSAFAPWQDTDIQSQKTWQDTDIQSQKTWQEKTFGKSVLSKLNVKYKSIDFENMKGNTLETGLDSNKTITAYNMCNKNGKLSDIIQKKTTNITKGITTPDILEYIPKNADISSLNCVDMLISEEDEKNIYKNLFNKFITGKNIKFGIVKSDYQKDFNLLLLKSKQYFKNDNRWIDNEVNEKKKYNMKTQLLITIGYLYFIKSTYENCMFGISKYFKKGDKTASLANYAITAVYHILMFIIGTSTAGTGLLAVGYIYMTVDMVKTELLFRNIKYASMEIIDNDEDVVKKFSDSDKKILGTNIISDNDLNPTIGGTKKKRKNKTKRKNKYNRKTRK